jgi:hypothetical protein
LLHQQLETAMTPIEAILLTAIALLTLAADKLINLNS